MRVELPEEAKQAQPEQSSLTKHFQSAPIGKQSPSRIPVQKCKQDLKVKGEEMEFELTTQIANTTDTTANVLANLVPRERANDALASDEEMKDEASLAEALSFNSFFCLSDSISLSLS